MRERLVAAETDSAAVVLGVGEDRLIESHIDVLFARIVDDEEAGASAEWIGANVASDDAVFTKGR